MVYKSSISKKQVFSIVNGKKHFKKNIYLRENINNNVKFVRHLEINDKSRTLAGFTHNGKMSLKSIKTNGNKLLRIPIRSACSVLFWTMDPASRNQNEN